MDPVLAQLYGTLHDTQPEPSQEELQKTAALEMLQKIAEDGDIDLNELSDDDIVDAYNELVGEGEDFEKDAAEYDEEEMAKLAAEEMLRNADYMGRTIAHAIVHELKGIQKAAADDESADEEEEKAANPLMAAVAKKKEEAKKDDDGDEKEKDAYAQVVEARAYDILKQANYVDEDGTVTPPDGFDKEAQAVIDRDALQVLQELGYPVSWTE